MKNCHISFFDGCHVAASLAARRLPATNRHTVGPSDRHFTHLMVHRGPIDHLTRRTASAGQVGVVAVVLGSFLMNCSIVKRERGQHAQGPITSATVEVTEIVGGELKEGDTVVTRSRTQVKK